MILPLSVQGAAVKTCAGGMDLLKNGTNDRTILQHQHQQSTEEAALEPKLPKGADSEAGSLTGHAFDGWPLSVSEGSVSSMDSLAGGEHLYSPSDYHSSLFRKPRSGVHMSESLVLSDDEAASDLAEHAFRKRCTSEEGLASAGIGMEEGDSAEAITPYSRHYFAKFLQEGGPFLVPRTSSPSFLPSSHALDKALEVGVVSDKPKAALALFHDSSEHSSDAESVSNSLCNSDTHSGMCSVGRESVAPDQGGSTPSEDFPCSRVKFMCSFGGKILPRPVDGTLRYVGGETRIITVPRDITYTDLMFKMTEFYGHALTLKYQLPMEELDALVSVSSDEDLENMMEEYDKIEASGQTSRLRVFLFNAAEYDISSSVSEQLGYFKDSEQRYVDAVNGLLEPPVSRKQSEGASSSTAPTPATAPPVENLLDVDPPWRVKDPSAATAAAAAPGAAAAAVGGVPIAALLTPPAVAQDVASLIQHVPVGLPLVSLPISSYQSVPPVVTTAPLSAPSSPPNAIRSGLVVPPAVADLMFQEPPLPSLVNLAGHLYAGEVSGGEAGYQDVESYASAAPPSSATGHDAQFRGVDSRWAPESPPKSQLLPRPRSYGKLSDHDRVGGRPEHVDVLPSLEFQRLVLHQQQQQSRQHPLDVQPDTYRRADLLAREAVVPTLQGTAAAFGAPPQLQPLHFRPALSGHDAVYWQMDQSQPQQGEDVYGLSHFHRSMSAQQLHPAGSAPSSPRLGGFRDVSGRQFGGQQSQYHRQYHAADGQYARMLHAYGDHPSRPFTASPPRHRERDHLQPPNDDRPIRQQQQLPAIGVALAPGPAAPLLSTEPVASLEHIAAIPHQYEPAPVSQSLYSEVLPRPAVPQYVMLNPFQDGLLPVQEHQEAGDSRRRIFPHGVETGVVVPPQPHYVLPIPNQRPDQYLAPSDHATLLPRYAEADWVAQQRGHDERLRPAGRAWAGQPNYLEETGFDVAASQSAPSSFSGFHFPEDADALLSQDPYFIPHHRTLRVDETVPVRSTPLLGGAGPGFGKGRGTLAENSQVLHHIQGRAGDLDYQVAASKPPLSFVPNSGGFPAATQALMDEYVSGISLAHSAAQASAAELTAVPTATLAVPVTVAIPTVNDGSQGFRTAMFYDEHLQTISGLLGEEGNSRPVESTGLDDDSRGVKYLRNGLDETPTTKYVVASVGYGMQSALALGQPSVHTNVASVCGDRPRSQTAYKPSPLGVQSNVADDLLSAVGFEADLGGQVQTVELSSSQHDAHHSGAALLAENMAASVLASREAPLLDILAIDEEKPVNPVVDNLGQPAAEPSLASLLIPEVSHPAVEQQDDTANGTKETPADEVGLSSEVKPKEDAVEELTIPGDVAEDRDDALSPVEDTAAKAKREAISRGLQTINNSDLEELRELGSGTFGTVYHGKWRGSDVAIKRIKASCFAGRPSEQERLRADFWREACTLSQLHHPNVVAFYGVVPDGPGGTLATVTEYMVNGSMKQVMQKKDRTIDRRKRLLIAMDAAFGMEYLHLKNIVHFDLKCENLLVNMRDPQRPVCKVGDLGLSKVKHQTMVSGGVRGTLPWMAPELLNGQAAMVTDKVDVYSFGIVMWELLTGEEPYASMHYGAIIGGIVNDSLRPDIPHWCEPAWRNLMERCWAADPGARPSFSDIASELRTMSAAHPKAHGQHGHGHNQGQAQGVGQGQIQAPGQPARQVSPPRAI